MSSLVDAPIPTPNKGLRGVITLWTLTMFSSLVALIHAKAYFGISVSDSDTDLLMLMTGSFLSILVWQISWYFRGD